MPTTAPAPRAIPVAPPAAARAADRNWRANHAALTIHQPAQAATLAAHEPDVTWATARDGSLSARAADGQWVAGCSVPLLAGRALLRSLAVEPGGQCLLAPAHAGLIVAARERIGPDPLLFVIHPDLDACRVLLACADLTADLAAGRLWFTAGDDWSAEFQRAFETYPGLAMPARFIQTRLTPATVVEPLIAEAQRAIGEVAVARSEELARRPRRPAPAGPGRTVVVAGSRFRLWALDGEALSAAVDATPGCTAVAYDTDDPLTAAPLALAASVDGASAVVAVDIGRAAAAPVLPAGIRFATWVTRPTIPAREGAEPQDHLVLADPAWRTLARRAGWPADRVHVGACPPLLPPTTAPATPTLGLLADTGPVEIPEAVQDYSSQRLLWEAMAADIREDPMRVGDATAYVVERAGQMNVDPEELNVRLFVEGLVLPTYTQGLARLLIAAGLPVRLWGAGWDEMPEFQPHAGGPISGSATLHEAVAASTVLVRPTPGRDWHPVESCGRPTLSAAGRTAANFPAHAAAALRHPPAAAARSQTLAAAIAAILGR